MLLQFGSITARPGLIMAPMAGITNHPFRVLAKEQGCKLLYSEMISAKGLQHKNNRHRDLLYYTDRERPIGFQIFGSEPKTMAEAAKIVEALGADFIDLNLGCPTRKIVSNGDGGALMRQPQLCSKIFTSVIKSVKCPVTVKMRKGWDEDAVNVLEIALRAEDTGIGAVAVHGRTVTQGYSGKADWEIIKRVKEELSIPVIANGDIDSPEAALAVIKETGCDGIMIGRAARGNPWIFSATLAALEQKEQLPPPTEEELVAMILKHFTLLSGLKGETAAAREMRRHSAWYIKGLPGAAAVRQKLIEVNNYEQTEKILKAFLSQLQV